MDVAVVRRAPTCRHGGMGAPVSRTSRQSWTQWLVYPCYTRLAMGLSHAVHLLMNINITCVGRAFAAGGRLQDVARELSDLESAWKSLDQISDQETRRPGRLSLRLRVNFCFRISYVWHSQSHLQSPHIEHGIDR